MIAAHDFTSDPSLSFGSANVYATDHRYDKKITSELKQYFREALLRRIDRCTESGCPLLLLSEFFSPKETSDLLADGYLNGHFSLDSLSQIVRRYPTNKGEFDSTVFRERIMTKSSNSTEERRRELFLRWLDDNSRQGEIHIIFPGVQ